MPGFALSTGVAKMSGHCLGLRVSMVLTIAKRFIYYHIPEKASCYLRRYKKEKKKKTHNFSEETSISVFLRDDSFS